MYVRLINMYIRLCSNRLSYILLIGILYKYYIIKEYYNLINYSVSPIFIWFIIIELIYFIIHIYNTELYLYKIYNKEIYEEKLYEKFKKELNDKQELNNKIIIYLQNELKKHIDIQNRYKK